MNRSISSKRDIAVIYGGIHLAWKAFEIINVINAEI